MYGTYVESLTWSSQMLPLFNLYHDIICIVRVRKAAGLATTHTIAPAMMKVSSVVG